MLKYGENLHYEEEEEEERGCGICQMWEFESPFDWIECAARQHMGLDRLELNIFDKQMFRFFSTLCFCCCCCFEKEKYPLTSIVYSESYVGWVCFSKEVFIWIQLLSDLDFCFWEYLQSFSLSSELKDRFHKCLLQKYFESFPRPSALYSSFN